MAYGENYAACDGLEICLICAEIASAAQWERAIKKNLCLLSLPSNEIFLQTFTKTKIIIPVHNLNANSNLKFAFVYEGKHKFKLRNGCNTKKNNNVVRTISEFVFRLTKPE